MKKEGTRSSWSRTKVMLTLAGLLLFSGALIGADLVISLFAVEVQSEIGQRLNKSGKQRFYAQQIAADAHISVHADTEAERASALGRLQETVGLMRDVHRRLAEPIEVWSVFRVPPGNVREIYLTDPGLHSIAESYWDKADMLTAANGFTLTQQYPPFRSLIDQTPVVVSEYDALTLEYVALDRRVSQFSNYATIFIFLLSIILIFLFLFIFAVPLINRITSDNRKLRETQKMLDNVIQQSGLLVYDYNLATDRIRWYGAIEKITGFDKDEFQSVNIDEWEQMIHPKDRDEVSKKLLEAQKNKTQFEADYAFRVKRGDYIQVNDRGGFVVNEEGEVADMVGVMTDVTRQQEAFEKVRRLDELKSKFITTLTHTTRTPLNKIRWSAETIISGDVGSVSKPVRLIAKNILTSDKDVLTVIRSMNMVLDIERGTLKLEKQRHDVITMAKSIFAEYEEQCEEKGLTCSFDAPKPSTNYTVELDTGKVRLVFKTLLDNAVRYTQEGQVNMRLSRKAGVVYVKVIDTGIGVPKGEQAYVFDLFYRGSNASEVYTDGAGIGLYIVKHIVDAHGWDIDLESSKDGTAFTISIPVG